MSAVPDAPDAPAFAPNMLGRILERAVFGGLLLLLLWLPLPFGSHRPWAESLFALSAFGLLGLFALGHAVSNLWPTHLHRAVLTMLLLWTLWLAWILAQTLAWPSAWVAQASALRVEHAQLAASVLRTTAPMHLAISLDAELTRSQGLLSAAYAVLFVLLAVTLRTRRRFEWLLWTLLLSGIGQALYGSVMVLSGLEYGAWGAKQAYQGFATGTFVNRNHFAGYLEICIGAAVGLIVANPLLRATAPDWRKRLSAWLAMTQDSRLFARASIVLFFVALILSQSRMGNVSAVGGACVASAFLLLSRRRGGATGGLILIGSILLIDIWLFGRWFGLEQLAQRYASVQTDTGTRLGLLDDIRKMIPVYGWIGSGLGTFILAYPQFRSPERVGFVDHAHNDYAQFLIETGIVGVVLLGALVLFTVIRAALILRRRRDPLAQGVAAAALCALGALAIHSATDFNLQIPANAATLVALMAAVWACGTESRRRHAISTEPATPGST